MPNRWLSPNYSPLRSSEFETTRAEWEKAGEISASLRKGGITVPLSDLIVAALALSGDLEIFATDPHFEQVRGLRLHNPGLH